jgi:hypothetical protein
MLLTVIPTLFSNPEKGVLDTKSVKVCNNTVCECLNHAIIKRVSQVLREANIHTYEEHAVMVVGHISEELLCP